MSAPATQTQHSTRQSVPPTAQQQLLGFCLKVGYGITAQQNVERESSWQLRHVWRLRRRRA